MLHHFKSYLSQKISLRGPHASQPLIYVMLFFLGFSLTVTTVYLDYQEKHSKASASANEILITVTSNLESTLYQKLSIIPAIIALVKAENFVQPSDEIKINEFGPIFDKFSAELNQQIDGVTSIQLAPDAVVSLMSNRYQNRAALGHDLLIDDFRRDQVIDAISKRQQVTVGPIQLIQGGRAVISRKAIFSKAMTFPAERYVTSGRVTADEQWLHSIPSNFWGLATVILDAETIFQEAKLYSVDSNYQLAIRNVHSSGILGEVFWGNEDIFNNPTATKNVSMPGGEWIIAIKSPPISQLSTIMITILGGVFTFLLVFSFHSQRLRNIEAVKSKAKSDFLTKMSHELRTPMNGIIGFSDLIFLRESELSEKNRQYLQHIRNASKSLLSLINDLLDLSLLDVGKVRLTETSFNLVQLVQETIEILSQEAEEKNIEIKVDVNVEESIRLHTDKERLKQVLINLLSNAIKYNKNSGFITVVLSDLTSSKVEIQVIDTGIGIPQERLSNLFKMFERLEVDTRVKGVGVGLVIVKNLIELMGGEITVSSEIGLGTTFTLSLPKILRNER